LELTSPSATLELSNASTEPILRLSNENNSITAGADLVVIEFYSGDDSGFGNLVKASISATQPLTSPVNGELVFKTSSSSTSLSEAMRISADGSVGIGTASPSAALEVNSGGGMHENDNTAECTFIIKPALTGTIHACKRDKTAEACAVANSSQESKRVN